MLALLLSSALLATHSPTSDPLAPRSGTFGSALLGISDANNDGIPDFVISDPGSGLADLGPGEQGSRARLWLISGRDRSVLWSVTSEFLGDRFGAYLGSAGDLNGDGIDEILVGTDDLRPGEAGYVQILSGLDGQSIHRLEGERPGEQFGSCVVGVGDLNGDGTPDLAVGSRDADPGPGQTGMLRIFSGRDWSVLHRIQGSGNSGPQIAAPGDLNGDGHTDVVTLGARGGVQAISGSDASVLWTSAGESFESICTGGDYDGDGVQDVFATSEDGLVALSGKHGRSLRHWSAAPAYSPVVLDGQVSGADLTLLFSPRADFPLRGPIRRLSLGRSNFYNAVGPPPGTWNYGVSLDALGDLDGDGSPDFAAGSSISLDGEGDASLWAWSGRTGAPLFRLQREGQGVLSTDAGWTLGTSFDLLPDIDGDGIDDLVVLYNNAPSSWAQGYAVFPGETLGISGADGAVLWRWSPIVPGDWPLNGTVRTWVDWDEDGFNDVLFWSRPRTTPRHDPSQFVVLSGKTGELLSALPIHFSVAAPSAVRSATAGLLLERQDRMWADGYVPHDFSSSQAWDRLQIWSAGPDRTAVIATIDAPPGTRFSSTPVWIQQRPGAAVWGIACLTTANETQVAQVRLIKRSKGPSGKTEWTWLDGDGENFARFAGLSTAVVGDLNDDGISDVLVAAEGRVRLGIPGKVVALSGASGQPLFELLDHGDGNSSFQCDGPTGWGCAFGASIASLADRDGDGYGSILVGSPLANLSSGALALFDLRTRKGVGISSAASPNDIRLGSRIATGLDYDGDGTPDLVAREGWYNNASKLGPRLWIYSGRTLELIRKLPLDD